MHDTGIRLWLEWTRALEDLGRDSYPLGFAGLDADRFEELVYEMDECPPLFEKDSP